MMRSASKNPQTLEFKMVCDRHAETVAELVTELLNDGWNISGSAFFADGYFYQPVIKESHKKQEWL